MSTTIDTSQLNQQIDLISQLNNTLNQFVDNNQAMETLLVSQYTLFQGIHAMFAMIERTTSQFLNNFEQLNNSISLLSQQKLSVEASANTFEELNRISNSTETTIQSTASQLQNINQQSNIDIADMGALSIAATSATTNLVQQVNQTSSMMHDSSTSLQDISEEINEHIESNEKSFSFNISISGIFTFFYDFLTNTVKTVFNLITNTISLMADFIKLTITLPFVFANFANKIGNEIRKKIIEQLGNATEAFKDTITFNSYTGKNIEKLSLQIKGSIKQFVELDNRLTQIFGYESEEKALAFANELVTGLGMFNEVFSKNLSNIDSLLYLKEAQNYLGIGVQEMSNYALNAFVNLENINDQLHRSIITISNTSKKYNIDSKSISSSFHKLRLNIQEFGHFSEVELSEMSAKLIKLKVSTEDAIGIFSRISTYESAADASTKLFQSFGMLIDAYDLITAKDPAEMIMMLRDGLFNTGKDFASLDRHGKQLMQQITGISEFTLNNIMNFNDIALSQEEIRDKLNSENPFELQLNVTKELTNSIKEIKKVLEFKSPFDAIYKGLIGNVAFEKETIKITSSYSELLENLNQFFLKISPNLIMKLTNPIILIIENFQKFFFDGRFFDMIKTGLQTFSNFIQNILTISTKSKIDDGILKYKIFLTKNPDKIYKISPFIKELLENKDSEYKDITEFLVQKGLFVLENNKLKISDKFTEEAFMSNLLSISHNNLDLGEIILDKLDELSFDNNDFTNLENINLHTEVLNDLTSSFINMMQQGKPLFEGFFNIGKTIMSSLIKSLLTGSAIFLNVINGNIEKLNTTNYSIGISKEDLKDLATNLAKEIGVFVGVFIPFAINTITDIIRESSEIISELIYPIIVDILANLYNSILDNDSTLSKTTKALIRLSVPESVIHKIHYEDQSNKVRNLQDSELQEISSGQDDVTKKLNEKTHQTNMNAFYVSAATPVAAVAAAKAATAVAGIAPLFAIPGIGWIAAGVVVVGAGAYIAYNYYSDDSAIQSMQRKQAADDELNRRNSLNARDIIRIDDKDSVELIASKDTGMLITLYDIIIKNYNTLFNELKITTENILMNNLESLNRDDEDQEMIDLINKIENLFDNIVNSDSKIKVEKLKFTE